MEPSLPLDHMTLEDKLRMLELLWTDLCRTPNELPSPAWHDHVLDQREQRVREGTSQFEDWDEAKRKLREQAS